MIQQFPFWEYIQREKKKKNINMGRYLNSCAYISIIYNSQDMGIT